MERRIGETAVCLGEFGTVVAVRDATAVVEFADGSVRDVSIAVLVVEGVRLAPGDPVLVSMGMALRTPAPHEQQVQRSWT
jgi:hydrogenase maturation factor